MLILNTEQEKVLFKFFTGTCDQPDFEAVTELAQLLMHRKQVMEAVAAQTMKVSLRP